MNELHAIGDKYAPIAPSVLDGCAIARPSGSRCARLVLACAPFTAGSRIMRAADRPEAKLLLRASAGDHVRKIAYEPPIGLIYSAAHYKGPVFAVVSVRLMMLV